MAGKPTASAGPARFPLGSPGGSQLIPNLAGFLRLAIVSLPSGAAQGWVL